MKYGEKLREFLLKYQIKIYNDFSGIKIFKEATVDTCVIKIKKSSENNIILVNNHYTMDQSRLSKKGWSFTHPKVLNLKDKILDKSYLIEDLNIKIKYGMKTGYNNAYIIDNETYDHLISTNIKNKEIIKPILKGTDINKFRINFKNRYIIIVKHWQGKTLKIEYPEIYNYLLKYEDNLKKRGQVKNGQHHWLDLDNNVTEDYLNYFNLDKIIWQRVCKEPNFALDVEKHCILDSMAFLVSENEDLLYFLIAILNSQITKWYLKLIGHKYGKTGFLVSNQYVKRLPIPKVNKKEKNKLISLSKKIMNTENNLIDWKNELNTTIYDIYNLNEEERNIIEKFL